MRAPCPVCGNPATYLNAYPGDDLAGKVLATHSRGLLGSGERCSASGLLGAEAQQLGADVGRDPQLPLRAHP